jgi:hypothetical protein
MIGWKLGVPGVFATSGGSKVKIGPVMASNSFGLVFVEILADAQPSNGGYKYHKGASFWLNPARITWDVVAS